MSEIFTPHATWTPVARWRESVVDRYRSMDPAELCDPPYASLAYGAAGVAYFLMRHAQLSSDDQSMSAALAWSAYAESVSDDRFAFATPESPLQPTTSASLQFHSAGVDWVAALVASAAGNESETTRRAEDFAGRVTHGADDSWDVSLGAAGLLLGCAQLLAAPGAAAAGDRLREAGDNLARALNELVMQSDVTSAEADIPFLGAAHGWGGIAHALLRWNVAAGRDPDQEALALLDQLVTLRRPSGRWPSRPGTRTVYRGWCHGSAGWAEVWTQAWQVTGDERMLRMAEECAADAISDEDTELSLCCGRAGEIFAALTLYRAAGERHWLVDAQRAVTDSVSLLSHDDREAHRLFSGPLGIALAALETEEPKRAAMPMFQPLG